MAIAHGNLRAAGPGSSAGTSDENLARIREPDLAGKVGHNSHALADR